MQRFQANFNAVTSDARKEASELHKHKAETDSKRPRDMGATGVLRELV
jgi:hypothetical protein